jgi:nucleoside-diphosphate-sugar epimerase
MYSRRMCAFTSEICRQAQASLAIWSNGSLRGLIAMVRRGLFFHIGPPGAIATYVHVDDVVSALMACALKPEAKGHVFNLSSDCSLDALIDHVAQTMAVKPPRIRMPEALVRAMVGLFERLAAFPLTTARVDALVNRTRYPSVKIESVLGFQFSRPMPAGIEDLVDAPRRSVEAT